MENVGQYIHGIGLDQELLIKIKATHTLIITITIMTMMIMPQN